MRCTVAATFLAPVLMAAQMDFPTSHLPTAVLGVIVAVLADAAVEGVVVAEIDGGDSQSHLALTRTIR